MRVTDPFSIDNSESSVNLIAVSNIQGLLFAATNEGMSCSHKSPTSPM